MATNKRDFLTLTDFTADELAHVVTRAMAHRVGGTASDVFRGRTAALILQQNSTRTRVGFEAGVYQLGGQLICLTAQDTHVSRGEPPEDTARVLSEYVDLIIIRAADHGLVETLASYASVPVINAMTSRFHPCQLLADMQTYQELRGPVSGRTVAFIGDGYNMCHSYIKASSLWDFDLRIACPAGFEPDRPLLDAAPRASLAASADDAVADADLVVTDVWSSMGHEAEQARRLRAFENYQVTEALLDLAKNDVLFMHCLPAHRGEEVNDTVLDDPRSVVWHEAGNRLHTQKALIEFLMEPGS